MSVFIMPKTAPNPDDLSLTQLPYEVLLRVFSYLSNVDIMSMSRVDRRANTIALDFMLGKNRSDIYQERVLNNQLDLLVDGHKKEKEHPLIKLGRDANLFWDNYYIPNRNPRLKVLLAAICLADAKKLNLSNEQQLALRQVLYFGSMNQAIEQDDRYRSAIVLSFFSQLENTEDSDLVLSEEQKSIFYSSVLERLIDMHSPVQETAWSILRLSVPVLPDDWLKEITSLMLGKLQNGFNTDALSILTIIAPRLVTSDRTKLVHALFDLLKIASEGNQANSICNLLQKIVFSLPKHTHLGIISKLNAMIEDQDVQTHVNARKALINIFSVFSDKLINRIGNAIQNRLEDVTTTPEKMVEALVIINAKASEIISKLSHKEKYRFILTVIHGLFHPDKRVVIATCHALKSLSKCELSNTQLLHAMSALKSLLPQNNNAVIQAANLVLSHIKTLIKHSTSTTPVDEPIITLEEIITLTNRIYWFSSAEYIAASDKIITYTINNSNDTEEIIDNLLEHVNVDRNPQACQLLGNIAANLSEEKKLEVFNKILNKTTLVTYYIEELNGLSEILQWGIAQLSSRKLLDIYLILKAYLPNQQQASPIIEMLSIARLGFLEKIMDFCEMLINTDMDLRSRVAVMNMLISIFPDAKKYQQQIIINFIKKVLNDTNQTIVQLAIKALTILFNSTTAVAKPYIISAIIKKLNETNQVTLHEAVKALAIMFAQASSDQKALIVPALIAKLNNTNPFVCREIIRTLANIFLHTTKDQKTSIIMALTTIPDITSSSTCLEFIVALTKIFAYATEDQQTLLIIFLIATSNNTEPSVCYEGINSLAKIFSQATESKRQQIILELVTKMSSVDIFAQEKIIKALAMCFEYSATDSKQQIFSVLITKVNDTSAAVYSASIKALEAIFTHTTIVQKQKIINVILAISNITEFLSFSITTALSKFFVHSSLDQRQQIFPALIAMRNNVVKELATIFVHSSLDQRQQILLLIIPRLSATEQRERNEVFAFFKANMPFFSKQQIMQIGDALLAWLDDSKTAEDHNMTRDLLISMAGNDVLSDSGLKQSNIEQWQQQTTNQPAFRAVQAPLLWFNNPNKTCTQSPEPSPPPALVHSGPILVG
jgi:hypothetical protein